MPNTSVSFFFVIILFPEQQDIVTATSEDEQRYRPFKLLFEKINQEIVLAVGSIYLFTF